VAQLSLKDNNAYVASCVAIAEEVLLKYISMEDIEKQIDTLNCYAHLSALKPPRDVIFLESVSAEDVVRAQECVLTGRFFAEHAAAGEATRLGLGTKYLLNIGRDFTDGKIAQLISDEKGTLHTAKDVVKEAGCSAGDLLPLSLGTRHMLQYSFDIIRLAQMKGMDPAEVLARQKMLIILNESTQGPILDEFRRCRFFGFQPANVFFMVQHSYHGINRAGERFYYDEKSPLRLHNHGQMAMQESMDHEIFTLTPTGERSYVQSDAFMAILDEMDDKLSYNIEDLGFLLDAIDYQSLGMALSLAAQGYRMMMEIVANNPENPQRGGMAAYDPLLKRNVMIEIFQLKGITGKDITYLNKNFNHYMHPADVWRLIRSHGLNMPVSVKDSLIYYQPVQGDINFLVKTAFVQRRVRKPIQSWKSPGTTPLTMHYLHRQDQQPGFLEHARRFAL
jgi:hypothetical protein